LWATLTVLSGIQEYYPPTTTTRRPINYTNSCNASIFGFLDGTGGFDVCVGDTKVSAIGLLGNALWTLQRALCLGNCFCKQSCEPAQIVCSDPEPLTVYNEYIRLCEESGEPKNNVIAQLVYKIIQYKAHCYCPNLTTAEEACEVYSDPKPCSVYDW
jgi:hypothetical protein